MTGVTSDYCGCCGNGITGKRRTGDPEPLWCAHCRGHVGTRPLPLWERTWFAQQGTDCPRQVPALLPEIDDMLSLADLENDGG